MEARTLGAMLRETATRHGKKVGYMAPGKSGFVSISWAEVWETVRRYAAALRAQGVGKGDRLAVLSENCVEFGYTEWACQCLGAILVPIYPTLPTDQAGYIVQDCGAAIAIAGDAKQADKTKFIEGVRTILLKEELAALASECRPLADEDMPIDEIVPTDVAMIIYTSGTTGTPKGAMLPHRAFIHVCDAAVKDLPIHENDVFLCFLPMSHVFEQVAGQALPVYLGATLAFAKNLASLANDMLTVKPTLFLCVPRFLESIQDRVMDRVRKDKPFRRKLFHLALSQGLRKYKGQFAPLADVLDKLVASKVRERTGGRVKYFVSGGAALPPSVAEFYLAMGMTVLQGYGLTETTGGTFVNRPENNKYWTVGEPLEMESKSGEDGELLVRGPGLMLGYYNLPEETAKAIDEDGWFHTGDIGEFDGRNLKITDRKKDLIVLGNGKNVAPQPIENRLKASQAIQEAMVLGDGMDSCAALIVPNFETVRDELGLPESAKLSDNKEARALIKREIDKVNHALAGYEAIKRFAVLDVPFTIEGGELTPTLKVKRKVVKEKYAALIATLAG